MTRTLQYLATFSAVAMLAACGGDPTETPSEDAGTVVDEDGGGEADANGQADASEGTDANGEADANGLDAGGGKDAEEPPPRAVMVSGKTLGLASYLSGENIAVGATNVLALGVVPSVSTASSDMPATLGEYTLELPANGRGLLFTSKQGYNQTYNNVTTETTPIMGKNIYVAEAAWLNEIALAHGVDLTNDFACHGPPLGSLDPLQRCVYGIGVGRILDDGTAGNGTRRPVAGVSALDFSISYGVEATPWFTMGPYFLDATGTSSTSTTSIVVVDPQGNYRGGYYLYFAEVPRVDGPQSRDLTVSIEYTMTTTTSTVGPMTPPVTRYFGPVVTSVFRSYGVTWAPIHETGQPPPPPPPGDIDFDTQIYPLFLPVNQGGFGCQGCHTNENGAIPTGNMNLFGGPEIAYEALNPLLHPNRVNTASPEASLVLRKPLYEASGQQDHPIFAFVSVQDPAYQLIHRWITEGATRGDVIVPQVSFSRDVLPILANLTNAGGAGCVSCHGDLLENPGGFYVGGTPLEVYEELVNELALDNSLTGELYRVNKLGAPERSLVLTNPLAASPELHPVKLFGDVTDPRHLIIYNWIAQGYQNN
jgi:hypothetical protein